MNWLLKTHNLAVELVKDGLAQDKKSQDLALLNKTKKDEMFRVLIDQLQKFNNVMLKSKKPIIVQSNSLNHTITLFSLDEPKLIYIAILHDSEIYINLSLSNTITKRYKTIDEIEPLIIQHLATKLQVAKEI